MLGDNGRTPRVYSAADEPGLDVPASRVNIISLYFNPFNFVSTSRMALRAAFPGVDPYGRLRNGGGLRRSQWGVTNNAEYVGMEQ